METAAPGCPDDWNSPEFLLPPFPSWNFCWVLQMDTHK